MIKSGPSPSSRGSGFFRFRKLAVVFEFIEYRIQLPLGFVFGICEHLLKVLTNILHAYGKQLRRDDQGILRTFRNLVVSFTLGGTGESPILFGSGDMITIT